MLERTALCVHLFVVNLHVALCLFLDVLCLLLCFISLRRQNMKVRINATGDTIVMKFVRPNADTKLEGYILGYGSSMFSKQFIQLPENGQPYETEFDAEPKYLIAVQPIPTNEVKKHCTGKVELQKPLHLVIGSVTPTSVLLSWGTLLKTPYEETGLSVSVLLCPGFRHYTVRYRERSRKWNYQTCPTSDTVIDNLKPNTVYEFGVQPNSKDGTGLWSKPVIHNISTSGVEGTFGSFVAPLAPEIHSPVHITSTMASVPVPNANVDKQGGHLQQRPVSQPHAEPQPNSRLQPYYRPPPQTKPQPQVKPLVKAQPVPKPHRQTEPQLQTTSQPIPQTQPQTYTTSRPKLQTQPQPHATPQPIPQTKLQTQPQPQATPQPIPQTPPQPQTVLTKLQTQPQPQATPQPIPQTPPQPQTVQTKLQTQPQLQATSQPTLQTHPLLQSQPKSHPKSNHQTTPQFHSEPKPKPTFKTKQQAQPQTQPQLKPQLKPQPQPWVQLAHPQINQPTRQHIPHTQEKLLNTNTRPQTQSTNLPQTQTHLQPKTPRPHLQLTKQPSRPRQTPKPKIIFSQPKPTTQPQSKSQPIPQPPPQPKKQPKPQSQPQAGKHPKPPQRPRIRNQQSEPKTHPRPRPQPPAKTQTQLVPHSQPISKPQFTTKAHSQPLPKPRPVSKPQPLPHPGLRLQPQTRTHSDPIKVTAKQAVPTGKDPTFSPHVIYKTDKKPDEPCSITSSLAYFPDEEGGDQNVTGPPRIPPSNVTVVTVEGCPSFVILDWQKSDNETREYEVVSTTKGPNGQEVSILTTNQTHTAVENLKPESSYEFKVTPKNELGTGPSSDPVSFSTESGKFASNYFLTGKDAIWTQFPFKADAYSECSGKQYVKRTWYRKFVGIQLCNSLRYKIYLSDSLNGKFYNIGDQTGHGEDHCQFVDSFLDGRTGTQMLADQLPGRPGFYRALRQEPVSFGEIGGKSHVTYVGWYECGTPIPGKW
uniref:ABI family member 3 binding protein n=1 Tax=Amphiprion percula TaxID=161767 RepID=A0A3P8S633_AMPPE